MKEIWIEAKGKSWRERKRYYTSAIENGADAVICDEKDVDTVKKLGKIPIVLKKEEKGKLFIDDIQKKVFFIDLKSKEDERKVIENSEIFDYIVVNTKDWKVIPLENIVAEVKKAKIIVKASSIDECELLLGVLEKGADGVVLSVDHSEIPPFIKKLRELDTVKINLTEVEIEDIIHIGMGDRACIDTISLLSVGEGMLIGSESSGFVLVHSETVENPYVETRPFRVNAGAVHSYILLPDGKTKYLSELKAGDRVLVVDYKGKGRAEAIGRVKIERRPMLLLKARKEEKTVNVVLQNAETIRVVKKGGTPVSVSEIKKGDIILAYFEEGGRHFGVKVDEKIMER